MSKGGNEYGTCPLSIKILINMRLEFPIDVYLPKYQHKRKHLNKEDYMYVQE